MTTFGKKQIEQPATNNTVAIALGVVGLFVVTVVSGVLIIA